MKKLMLLLAALLMLSAALPASAEAPDEYVLNIAQDSHKIRNKWDLSGTFESYPGYYWGSLGGGVTWTYSIHIKEAMDGSCSVGSIHFMTEGVDVVGHVDATKRWYSYDGWAGADNLAAVGTAVYNDVTYYFMFLYANRAVWFALSDTPYDAPWAANSVWAKSLRAYEVHSPVPSGFPLDYKAIHG